MGDGEEDDGADAHGTEPQEYDAPTPSTSSQSTGLMNGGGGGGGPSGGSGYVGGLSAAQEAVLSEFRRRTWERSPHPRFHDVLLLRFLRARKFDIEAAWSMFSEHLDWRESTGLDVLPGGASSLGSPAPRFPEMPEIKRCYPHGFHALDKLGRPLYIERLGRLDLGRLLRHTSPERVASYFAHELERLSTHRLLACSLAEGRLVEKILTVLDLDGLSVRTVSQAAARRMLQAITKVQQRHYPETMGEMIIMNAPRAFHLAWKFACPMIDVGTVQNIRGLQEDPAQRLRELVEPSNLPRFLGGECECDCPGGCLWSDRGPWQDPGIIAELEAAPQWEIWNRLAHPTPALATAIAHPGEAAGSLSARLASTLAGSSPTCRSPPRRQRCTWSPITDSWHSITASCAPLDDDASVWPRATDVCARYQSMDNPSCSLPVSSAAAAVASSRGSASGRPTQLPPGPRHLPATPEEASRGIVAKARASGTSSAVREASRTPPSLDGIEDNLSSEDLAPLWQKIRRMEETYVSVLETWLAKAAHLEGQGSIKDMQEAQRYFDTIASAQHAQATVHTAASQFYALMAQHAQVAAELREAETRLGRLRPQDEAAPNGAFVEQALRVSELSEALRKTQVQRDNLEREFRRGVEDFRRAREQAVESSSTGSRRPAGGSSCCMCMVPAAAARRRIGGAVRGTEPCAAELQQAIAELEVDEIRRWNKMGRFSEATTRASSSAFTSPSSLSASARDDGSSPSAGGAAEEVEEAAEGAEEVAGEEAEAEAEDAGDAAEEAEEGTAWASEASRAEPSEAGASFYTCEGEASAAAVAASSAAPGAVAAPCVV